jgi:putative Holliday junction resolvase
MRLSIHPLAEFATLLPFPCRLAAMDIGKKTIGLALSTPDWRMVTPMGTIQRTKWQSDLTALGKALKGFDIKGLVIGLPYNMDDSEGPQAQSVRQTVTNMIEANPVWLDGCLLAFADERLSTAAANETLSDHISTRDAKDSGALDAVAAQVILQRALDVINKTRHTQKDSST